MYCLYSCPFVALFYIVGVFAVQRSLDEGDFVGVIAVYRSLDEGDFVGVFAV